MIENGFEFIEKNGGACVVKAVEPGAVCVVPDTLGGLPVTELGDRALARTEIKEVYLPKTLRRIGRYGFYNCEKLHTLHFYAETREIGGGIFNGCRKIREIYIHLGVDEKSAIRDFVTEIMDRVIVHCLVPDGQGGEKEISRVVFPEFYDESIENSPARNLSFSIHGTGQKYRYCIIEKKIQYDKYDKVFFYETIEESVGAAAEIAINRLMFPYGLTAGAKEKYEQYLLENLCEVLICNMHNGENFRWVVGNYGECRKDSVPYLSESEMDRLLDESSKHKLAEASGVLLDLKRRLYPAKKKKFEF
ncbi:MAG: leucine-rich repeat protein [Lachnospiraceae bacterium]|nr:leucine-rich repeat protein [Lachnospiraceae bacterium]